VITTIKRIILRLILWGYSLLYHQFAWMYDFAAWLVSARRWDNWIRSTGDFVSEGPLLDLGCGKGVLLEHAGRNHIVAFGLDESPQMLRYSQKRLSPDSGTLVRGLGQSMPFASRSFRTLTATFPAPYLFEQSTLMEISRVLTPRGQLIILITAVVSGHSLHDLFIRLVGGLFGFGVPTEKIRQRLLEPLQLAGFKAEIRTKFIDNCLLFFILAQPNQTG
jgi:ubiquinone/menaquinone biosynthesis C-methylase UbiE